MVTRSKNPADASSDTITTSSTLAAKNQKTQAPSAGAPSVLSLKQLESRTPPRGNLLNPSWALPLPQTLEELAAKRREFNQKNNCFPIFDLTFLLANYVDKAKNEMDIDFEMLNDLLTAEQASKEKSSSANDDANQLSVASLSRDEKRELFSLMTRSSGHINLYRLFGFEV